MNLDTANEHVLITGPNGAGKSTLSFCMGAVLRSSKVDISGLKSQNLPEDQTWRASIHFLFKNEGPRSEERRVGKECRSEGRRDHEKKKKRVMQTGQRRVEEVEHNE